MHDQVWWCWQHQRNQQPSKGTNVHLGEGEESFAFDVTSDLVNWGRQLVDLLSDVWWRFIIMLVIMTMIFMLMILLLLLLLPSAMHCGNFARFSSFLNKGTMTSSTRAQNCSDQNNWFDILGLQHLKEQYSPPNNCQLMSGWSSRDDKEYDNEGTMNVEYIIYNHRVSLDEYRHKSSGSAIPAR